MADVFATAWRGAGGQGAMSVQCPPDRNAAAGAGNASLAGASTSLCDWLRSHDFPLDDVNARRHNQTTPLMQAARFGRADLIVELLALGAQLELRNADGNNALWLACFSDNVATIAALIAAGIDLDNRNDNGSTCLMYAASAGKAASVQQLLAAGAAVHLDNLDGFTALDMAATLECLQLLRRASTSPQPALLAETDGVSS